MKGSIALLLMFAPLWGASSDLLHEVRGSFQELNYKIHAQQTEMDLLLERMAKLEAKLAEEKPLSPQESRLAKIETSQKNLAADLKTLKIHLEQTDASLQKCQKQLASLDKQLSTDIASLKSSLQSMIVLLKGGSSDGSQYTVSPGDSLGKIAQKFKVSTKAIKECNQLKNDTIFVGQQLSIPQ